MMATDDATLNAGDKKKTQPIKGTQEKKLKGNLKFVTGQKERFMKNWLALGVFFFVFSKKKICCSCSICHLLPGSLNVLFQSETYGWWEKVKAEEKQNRSRIRDLHVCSFEIIKAKYRLTWTTHTFPLSEFEYFEKKSSFFPLIHVVMAMLHTVFTSSGPFLDFDYTWCGHQSILMKQK